MAALALAATAALLKKYGFSYDHSQGYRDFQPFYARVGDAWTVIDYTGEAKDWMKPLVHGKEIDLVDIAANWWNSEDDSNLTRVANKGMVKKDDFRILYKSDMIVNSPFAYLADMPADLKKAIATAFFDAAKKDKDAFDRLSDGKNEPFQPVTHKEYEPIVELNKFVDALRKKGS